MRPRDDGHSPIEAGERSEHGRAVAPQLGRTDASDLTEFVEIRGPDGGEFAQHRVVEDDVGRHRLSLRFSRTPGT